MNKYEHIIVPEIIKKAIKYSPRGGGGGSLSIPMRKEVYKRQHQSGLFIPFVTPYNLQ